MVLLTIVRKLRRKEKEIRILILGLDNSGKTTVVKTLTGEDPNTVSPTLGFNIVTLSHRIEGSGEGTGQDEGNEGRTENKIRAAELNRLEGREYRLNIWDVGGQKTIRAYWRNYFESTDALIWVVDSADRTRLDLCRHELHALLREERLAGASLLVLANKQDIQGALSPSRIRRALKLDDIVTHHWSIHGCAAIGGEKKLEGKIAEGMNWVVKDVASRIYLLD